MRQSSTLALEQPPITSLLFRRIDRTVRRPHQILIAIIVVVLALNGDARRHSHSHRLPRADIVFCAAKRIDQPVAGDVGTVLRCAGKDQHKLFAAITPDNVGIPRTGFQQACRAPQYLVPGMMAVGVVNLFEVVQIDKDDGQGPSLALGAGKLL